MRRKRLLLWIIVVVFIVSGYFILKDNILKNKKEYIDIVLKKPAYSYLPAEAKDYIKNIYNQTGNIILSEKNKKVNSPYLNPKYVEYLTLNDEKKRELEIIPYPTITDYNNKEEVSDNDIPSKYDLRSVNGKNYTTPIRNQGNLGTCWTFATAGSIESYVLKTNDKKYDENSMLISERQIDYATAIDGLNDYKSKYVSFIQRNLGGGGNYYISTVAMANGISLFNYKNFKAYNDNDLSTMEVSDVLNFAKSEYEVNSTKMISSPDFRASTDDLTKEQENARNNYLNEVKSGIMKYGAAYVSTSVSKGCYYNDEKLNNMLIDVYSCNSTFGGHAMQIIGWDDNIEYSYCNIGINERDDNVKSCSGKVIKGKGVWILKNSWGEDSQYPLLAYDSLQTGVSFVTDMNETAERNGDGWKYNYILGSELGDTSSSEVSMSSTSVTDAEELRKIKFISQTYNSTFDIIINYSNGKTYKTSKTSASPGLVTIELPYNLFIDKDTTIKISSADGKFIDKVMVFTAGYYLQPSISYKGYENKISTPKTRLYQEFKRVDSNKKIEYKIYDSNNNDVTNTITYTNNTIAENNVNTLFDFSNLTSGKYKLETIYDGEIIDTDNIQYLKMEGSGTENDPYVIMTPLHLDQIRNNLDAYYVLGDDIDMTEITRTGSLSNEAKNGIGHYGWTPIYDFSGSLDGQGHTIKGLYQRVCLNDGGIITWGTSGYYNNGGLFGKATDNITIKNLNIDSFDIEFGCKNGTNSFGGTLIGSYTYTYDTPDTNVTIENVSVKNSKITSLSELSHASSLIGYIDSSYGNVYISNVYLDSEINSQTDTSFLSYNIYAKNLNINNIQSFGQTTATGSKTLKSAIINEMSCQTCSVKNIFSNVSTNLNDNSFINKILYVNHGQEEKDILNLKNIYVIGNDNTNMINTNQFDTYGTSNIENSHIYQRGKNTNELSSPTKYKEWENFDEYWSIKNVNGIKRYPMLKISNNEYTEISDISIKQELNKKYYIFDYITPKNNLAKDVICKSKDEKIVKIDDTGRIIPISSGTTTIRVESLYDGYVKDIPITIEYKPHYTIKFDKNDNEATGEMEDVEVDINTDYTVKNKFEKEYYDLNGWSTVSDGSKSDFKSGLVTKQKDKTVITLYAQWRGKKSTVTIDPAGGVVNQTSMNIYYNETFGQVPIPTREGYGFDGYNDGINKNIIYSAYSLYYRIADYYKDGLTLTAIWKKDAYTIIFHSNDKLNLSFDDCAYNNKEHVLEKNRYERENYIFKEWNTKADGTGQSYADKDTINLSNVTNSVLDLYAIWQPVTIEVTFDSSGGQGTMDKQSVPYNEKTSLNKNAFTKAGYTFKEWNTKADGTGTSYKDGEKITITENITLYAVWEENFSYKIDGYEQDEKNKYISSIKVGTTLDEFTSHIKLNDKYTVKVDTKQVNDKELLYTGGKTKIYKDDKLYAEYTNVVIGDVNGNAIIDIIDYIRIMKDIMETQKLSGPYLKAADVNQNGSIDIIDYIRIMKMIMEEK